jgi:UDP-N-acetylmuramate--alanine ligase
MRYHFIGIGGSGMRSLAVLVVERGSHVTGSDRSHDRGSNRTLFAALQKRGVHLYPQDGSGVETVVDAVVVSTAIESNNRDLVRAKDLRVPVIHRAKLLADLFNPSYGIAVGGTSGKSTIVAMIARILEEAGLDPTVVNGAAMVGGRGDAVPAGTRVGGSDFMVVETDESDGSIVDFTPNLAVVSSITKDHKSLTELEGLFSQFAQRAEDWVVLNADCPLTTKLRAHSARVRRYGIDAEAEVRASNVRLFTWRCVFAVEGEEFEVGVPGKHNVSNALAAIATGRCLDIPIEVIRTGLGRFKGIKRRLEKLGEVGGILVLDDFSHNPEKIRAAISTLRKMGERIIIVYQPHGYGPTRFLLDELSAAFREYLKGEDVLILLDIYDAGGTADRKVQTKDLALRIARPNVFACSKRADALAMIGEVARSGDVIVVMGARDDTLSEFGRAALDVLSLRARDSHEGRP